jgi:tRNA (guanine37-N1)-methyltransferase
VTRFTVVSILPEIVDQALAHGVVGRARTAGTLALGFVNPRDFTTDRHRSVDDTPYGGGPGMVMKCEPLVAAIESAAAQPGSPAPAHRVLLSPTGAPLTQARVRALAAHEHLVLVCGRYEGIDERVVSTAIDEEISLGDFVLTGGELGAACIIDAVARFLPGVLGDAASADDESFSAALLEYPQYTRPASFRDQPVPEILLGGNHAAIRAWRRRESLRRTARRRPDLYARHRLTKDDVKLAAGLAELEVAERTTIALVHHPVLDRTGALVTTAVTNLDLHDIARSAATYGLAGYHVVTPIESQRDKAQHIANLWQEEQKEWRARALRLCTATPSVTASIEELTRLHGRPPLVAATSADPARFMYARAVTPAELIAEVQDAPGLPLLILFGTGWGLADTDPSEPARAVSTPSAAQRLTQVSRIITPISGRPAWNHLSVRSAVAILLDRLFGLRDDTHAKP